MDPLRRKLIVDSAMANLTARYQPAQTPVDRLLVDLDRTINDVKRIVSPIIRAGGAAKKEDRDGKLRPMVFGLLMERIHKFSKDELEILACCLIGDRIMDDVESDPWGKGQPDPISPS